MSAELLSWSAAPLVAVAAPYHYVEQALVDDGRFTLEEALLDPEIRPPEWIWEYAVFRQRQELSAAADQADVPDDDAPDEVVEAYAGGLPPIEMRLIDPRKVRFRTPLTETGEIDTGKLIDLVNATIKPGHDWGGEPNRHHKLWPLKGYLELQEYYQDIPVLAYRNLATHIMRVPIAFHRWLHAITLPPPMPDPAVMRQHTERWQVFGNFFGSIRATTTLIRLFERDRVRRELVNKPYTEEQEKILLSMLQHQFSGVVQSLIGLEEVPVEDWPFAPDRRL